MAKISKVVNNDILVVKKHSPRLLSAVLVSANNLKQKLCMMVRKYKNDIMIIKDYYKPIKKRNY